MVAAVRGDSACLPSTAAGDYGGGGGTTAVGRCVSGLHTTACACTTHSLWPSYHSLPSSNLLTPASRPCAGGAGGGKLGSTAAGGGSSVGALMGGETGGLADIMGGETGGLANVRGGATGGWRAITGVQQRGAVEVGQPQRHSGRAVILWRQQPCLLLSCCLPQQLPCPALLHCRCGYRRAVRYPRRSHRRRVRPDGCVHLPGCSASAALPRHMHVCSAA